MSLLDNAIAKEPTSAEKGVLKNRAVPGVEGYFPLNEPLIGTTSFPTDVVPNEHVPKLFTPIKIRGIEFKNRIWASPMCQYSAEDGVHTDWHFVHLGALAARGVGSITIEATAVSPEGRITPEDSGLWNDEQMVPLKRSVNFAHAMGTHIGIQLSHAGRKASTHAPWVQTDIMGHHRNSDGNAVAAVEAGGWPDDVWGPSTVPFSATYPKPKEMTLEFIEELKQKFVDATKRCIDIGLDFIELHFAHGYLGHAFLSPLSNKRTDKYGGSLENRMRFPLEVIEVVRQAWPKDKPLFVRYSASDWAPEERNEATGEWVSWGIEQTRVVSKESFKRGVDLIDVSSGGGFPGQKIAVGPNYQVPFSEALKKDGLVTGAVGLITDPHQAEEILQKGQADVIYLARELIRHADWPLFAAQTLGVVAKPPVQYERAWTRMYKTSKMM